MHSFIVLSKQIKKADLKPFVSMAGDHAINDMASDEDDPWNQYSQRRGVECIPLTFNSGDRPLFPQGDHTIPDLDHNWRADHGS